jgi:hypothetical protein
MSEIKDLSITSATFTVKVLRVDNHKMTKATFRQIRVKEFELWPENKYILGYVMDEDAPWLLYMCDNLLWKCPVWDWQLRISESDEELLRNNGVKWGKRAFEHYDQLFIAT